MELISSKVNSTTIIIITSDRLDRILCNKQMKFTSWGICLESLALFSMLVHIYFFSNREMKVEL